MLPERVPFQRLPTLSPRSSIKPARCREVMRALITSRVKVHGCLYCAIRMIP